MNRIFAVTKTLLVVALLVLLPGEVVAQMQSRAAILPLAADEPLAPHLTAEIHRALRAPLSSRRQITVLDPGQVARRMESPSGEEIVNPAYLTRVGKGLEVDQVAGCRIRTQPGDSPARRRYTYTLAYFDVIGGEMMAESSGLCPNCTDVELVSAIVAQIPSLYVGPYPFGLDTRPSGAKVRHEGEDWGTTPIRRVLPGGTYTIILEKPGYRSLEVQFPMPADRPVYATLPLTEDPDYVPPVVVTPPVEAQPPARPERGPQVEEPPPVQAERGPLPEEELEDETPPPPPVARPERGPQVDAQPPARPERGPQVEEPPPVQAERGPLPEEELEDETLPPPPVARVEKPMSLQRKWAWRSLGLTVALAAGGGGFTAAAVHSDSRAGDSGLLPDTQSGYARRRDAYWIGAYSLYGLSAAALTTALVLFFTESPDPQGPQVGIVPMLEPGGAGVSAALRY